MDLSNSIVPDSTQWNAEDFLSGDRSFVIAGVRVGTSEQPVNIDLVGSDRAYRPSKSMRRVLVAAWGADADAYVGRSLTLYRDPEVTFGRDKPGGIKISALSGIDKRMTIALTVTRGKRAPHTIDPLPDVAPPPPALTAAQIAASTDVAELGAWWKQHHGQRAAIEARVAEVKAAEVTAEDAFPATDGA